MGEQKQEKKLNWMQLHLPEGLPVALGWLERQGYSLISLRSKLLAGEQVAMVLTSRPPATLPTPEAGQNLRLGGHIAANPAGSFLYCRG